MIVRAHTQEMIDAARDILEEIQPASIRAVCYRLFTMGLIDSMRKSQTNRVSRNLVFAREEGLIPWEWVVDETRAPERPGTWSGPGAFSKTVARAYRRDRWLRQTKHLEIWSEKGTVRGTLAPVLEEFGVTFRVFHGYVSATTVKDIAEESLQVTRAPEARQFFAFYVGDWDPSGLHMSAVDLPERLDRYGAELELERVALVPEDLTDDLPSFDVATKTNDPRWRYFLQATGEFRDTQDPDEIRKCWELDAMSPVDLRDRVRSLILDQIDPEHWEEEAELEQRERKLLGASMKAWRSRCAAP